MLSVVGPFETACSFFLCFSDPWLPSTDKPIFVGLDFSICFQVRVLRPCNLSLEFWKATNLHRKRVGYMYK